MPGAFSEFLNRMNDQRSTLTQIRAMIRLANEHGLYDAADWVRDRLAEQQEHKGAK